MWFKNFRSPGRNYGPLTKLSALTVNGYGEIPKKKFTNEKRGRLKVVSIDRSRFNLFTLRVLSKPVSPHPVKDI